MLEGKEVKEVHIFSWEHRPGFERTTHVAGNKLVLKAIDRHKKFPKRKLKKVIQDRRFWCVVFGLTGEKEFPDNPGCFRKA